MVVQLPPDHDGESASADLDPARTEVDAGVIDDARARHRRERWAGTIVVAIAIAVGLVVGLGGGGGGSEAGHHANDHGLPAGAGQRVPRPLAVVTHVGAVSQFGLLAPGVGWAVNGRTLALTRDGGARWDVLARRQRKPVAAAVGRASLADDLSGTIGLTASPSRGVMAISFANAPVSAPCGRGGSGAAVVALSGDSGHTWTTHVLPGCREANSLSFVSARVGYTVSSASARDSGLYRTVDGGARWTLVSRFSAPMAVSFGTRADGLAWVTPNTRSAAAVLYRTTDGGRSWRRTHLCGPTADPALTVYCGLPHSFGSRAVVLAVAQDLSKAGDDRAYIYQTADAGRSWSRRPAPLLNSPEMPTFSAPDPSDLFLYSTGGVLYRSTDGGRHWRSSAEPRFKQLYEMQFVNAHYGWILAAGQFDYTDDGGRSWRRL